MDIPAHKYACLFASCLITRGPSRSVLVDTQRNSYELIPNALVDLLEEFQQEPASQVMARYQQDRETIMEYLDFLLEKEFIFFAGAEEKEMFPPLPVQWDFPGQISNAILDLGEDGLLIPQMPRLAGELEALGCRHVQLRCFTAFEIKEIKRQLLDPFNETRLQSVELIMPLAGHTKEEIIGLMEMEPRLISVTVYGCSEDDFQVLSFDPQRRALFTRQVFTGHSHCGQVGPLHFTYHLLHHMEGQFFNTCLNRKISVGTDGFIRNCPSLPDTYGHISTTGLAEALAANGFRQRWSVTKSQVKTCAICEFRNICTDCRAFLQDPEDLLSKPAKCSYDPYTCSW